MASASGYVSNAIGGILRRTMVPRGRFVLRCGSVRSVFSPHLSAMLTARRHCQRGKGKERLEEESAWRRVPVSETDNAVIDGALSGRGRSQA